jgi:hypothetical protein
MNNFFLFCKDCDGHHERGFVFYTYFFTLSLILASFSCSMVRARETHAAVVIQDSRGRRVREKVDNIVRSDSVEQAECGC